MMNRNLKIGGAYAFTAAAMLGLAFPVSAEDAAPDYSEAVSGEYKTDPEHAYISFSYDHQGYSHPILRWRSWSADLDWNADDPTESSVYVLIDASSIDSGVDRFDGHLKSERFFDTENFPDITFESESLTINGENSGTMTGTLTIKEVSKPVTLDVTLNKAASETQHKRYKLGFSAVGQVKRSDYGVDFFTPVVGDDVTVRIEAEFVKMDE